MRYILRFPLILPLAAAGVLLAGAGAGTAQAMTPAEALRILAQARAVDGKCHYLAAPVHAELSGYVAKAEIVTASRQGAQAAKTAVGTGQKAGLASACGADSKDLVLAALDAARQAMRQARAARAVQNQRRKAARKSARRKEEASHSVRISRSGKAGKYQLIARISPKRRGATRKVQDNGGLARYVSLTTAYYRDLRCKRLPYTQSLRLWKQVRALHFALIRSAGGPAVARAKATARARAARLACGPRLAWWR